MLVGRVVEHQLGYHPYVSFVGLSQKFAEINQGSVIGVNVEKIGDIVPAVAQRGWIKRQEPDGRNTKVFDVIELLAKPLEVPDPVVITVKKCFDVDFVDYGVFEP